MTHHFLLISNLAKHPNESFYTDGKPWSEFREISEKNLKNLTRFQKKKVTWTVINAEDIEKHKFKNILQKKYTGIILSGSPYNIDDDENWIHQEKQCILDIVENSQSPLLGVCFGHQLLADILGGTVSRHKKYWKGNVAVITENNEEYISWANHGDYISRLPKNAKTLATGPDNMPYIVQYKENVYGIQCHLERKVECPLSEKFWEKMLGEIFS